MKQHKTPFLDALTRWYARFDQMKVGEAIDVTASGGKNVPLFVDMCKNYIDMGHWDYEFSNDFKFFKRIEPFK